MRQEFKPLMNMTLTKRDFLKLAGLTAILETGKASAKTGIKAEYNWKMATAWPKGLPGAGTGALLAARIIEELSEGRISIKVYGAGEICGAFEIFDSVSSGQVDMGHATAYYWFDKHPLCQIFSSVPFGLNPAEMHAWLEFCDGQKLWDDLYQRFGLKPFAAGNTGIQMGGWFNREINDINDFRNLRIRAMGIGSLIMQKAGATIVRVPLDRILPMLQSGEIDAADWIAPFDDQRIGLYRAAKYYYWPGWHEPGTLGELVINLKLYNSLPDDIRLIIRNASMIVYLNMWTEYSANNSGALLNLMENSKVKMKRFNDRTLMQLAGIADQILGEIAATDDLSSQAIKSYIDFKKKCMNWNQIGEEAYSLARSLIFTEVT